MARLLTHQHTLQERRTKAEEEIRQMNKLLAVGIDTSATANLTIEQKEKWVSFFFSFLPPCCSFALMRCVSPRLVVEKREKMAQAIQEAERRAMAKMKKWISFVMCKLRVTNMHGLGWMYLFARAEIWKSPFWLPSGKVCVTFSEPETFICLEQG